ncbi:MAG: CubicO group peptidase (beta-lactamase class C family) [Algoriphagus sp.]
MREIIKKTSLIGLDKLSEEDILKRLEIDPANWTLRFGNGVIDTSAGLEMTPRGMLKIGITYLNNGVFDGAQIMLKQWIKKVRILFQITRTSTCKVILPEVMNLLIRGS